MTAYQQSELLVAGRGLLIILGTLLLGTFVYSVHEYYERRKFKARYPDDESAYANELFGKILGKNLTAVVGCVGFSLGTGLAFGAFGAFMIFIGFPLIFLILGVFSFLVPYP